MLGTLVSNTILLTVFNTVLRLIHIFVNGVDIYERCQEDAPVRRLQEATITTLVFESTVTLGFDSDQDAVQDAFTNAVVTTFTLENVAETLQTPELEEKYGEFQVIGTETDGDLDTLSPTASPTRKPTGQKSKKAKSSKTSKGSKKGKSETVKSKKAKSKKGKESKKGKKGTVRNKRAMFE